jgi:hypothetical protein
VSELPNGLGGKVKAVATARKKKWEMSSTDWEFVDKLVAALEVRDIYFSAQLTRRSSGPQARHP